MPKFELLSLKEATMETLSGKRADTLKDYLKYLNELGPGQAGKLQPSEGESTASVRRRIGAAAKLAGKNIIIKRAGSEVYFWENPQENEKPRRGRRRTRKLISE